MPREARPNRKQFGHRAFARAPTAKRSHERRELATGAMRTEKQYENFILEAEWRHLSSGGNSGIFIWGTPIAAPGVPFLRGIEVQVLDHGYNVDGKNQWYTTHGDVFPIHGASMKPFGRHNGQRSFPSEGAVMLFRTDLERRFVAD